MSLLTAFEAAARHQSFTAAAAELSLTQSAVSRQVRALEKIVGCALFTRERQTVRITQAGEAYAADIRTALHVISTSTIGFRANPEGGTLNLAILPTFGTRWLAPRLSGFLAARPGVTINLSTRLAPFDFNSEALDAAIHFGAADWSGAELDPLMSEEVAPFCSPAMRERYDFTRPEQLLHAPLIHLVSRGDGWNRWFAARGVGNADVRGMSIDQFATAAQAAAAGIGIALLPTFLVRPEVERGELVSAFDVPVTSMGRYYLAWPRYRAGYPPLESFRTWLQGEVRR